MDIISGSHSNRLRPIEIICSLLLLIFASIIPEVHAGSNKEKEPALSCKYFDSLSSDLHSCKSLNRGHKTEVKPEGEHKLLYRSAMKILASSEDGRKEIETSGGKISFEAWMVDLNGDGLEEAILFPLWGFRGASGNGDIIVFKQQQEKTITSWKPIGFLQGHHVRVEPMKSNQYYSLVTNWHMGSENGSLTRYKMNLRAGQYLPSKETEYSCTLQSEEPCFSPKVLRRDLRSK